MGSHAFSPRSALDTSPPTCASCIAGITDMTPMPDFFVLLLRWGRVLLIILLGLVSKTTILLISTLEWDYRHEPLCLAQAFIECLLCAETMPGWEHS
jgi:hypothetical protein